LSIAYPKNSSSLLPRSSYRAEPGSGSLKNVGLEIDLRYPGSQPSSKLARLVRTRKSRRSRAISRRVRSSFSARESEGIGSRVRAATGAEGPKGRPTALAGECGDLYAVAFTQIEGAGALERPNQVDNGGLDLTIDECRLSRIARSSSYSPLHQAISLPWARVHARSRRRQAHSRLSPLSAARPLRPCLPPRRWLARRSAPFARSWKPVPARCP
jgi:hypothetical protein